MLLPEPEGPNTATSSPRLDAKVEAAECNGLGGAGAEDLEDVVELDRTELDLVAVLGLAVEAPYLHRKLSIISR